MSDPVGQVSQLDGVGSVVDTGNHQVRVTIVEQGERTTIVDLGVEGPIGPQGPVAEPMHFVLIDATSFTAQHDFNWRPNVWFIDRGGDPILFSVQYPDASHVYVQFPTPFTGTMYLR